MSNFLFIDSFVGYDPASAGPAKWDGLSIPSSYISGEFGTLGADGAPSYGLRFTYGGATSSFPRQADSIKSAIFKEVPEGAKLVASFSLRALSAPHDGVAYTNYYHRFFSILWSGQAVQSENYSNEFPTPLAIMMDTDGYLRAFAYLPTSSAIYPTYTRALGVTHSPLTIGDLHHFEVMLDISTPSSAEFAVYIDGVLEISGTYDAAPSTEGDVDYTQLSGIAFSPQFSDYAHISEVFIYDPDRGGPSFPAGALSFEYLASDAVIEEGGTPISGAYQTFSFADRASGGEPAIAVLVEATLDIGDATGPTPLMLQVDDGGGTQEVYAEVPAGPAPSTHLISLPLSSDAEINAAQVGIKKTGFQ